VSYELRTPLNAVVNFAHILAQGGQGEVNEAQADYLRRIEESGRQILQVLNDLLDMAQIESGEFRLYPEPVNLRQICEETVRYAQAVVLDKDVAFIEDYPETWPCVNVDKVRLKQSLINLLRNAARHTERGHIALRVRPENGVVRLHVEDSGSGIDAHYQQMIFQEFRQVDEQAARRRIGTGLGLSLTRHVVERHGGTVTVDSAVGEGSTFTITLPVWQGAPAAVK
jgi:signal transduction histidine kinase